MTRQESPEVAVRKWLREQGYPFELHVGRVAEDTGWYVEHSVLYNDPETGKIREIDVFASAGVQNSDLWLSVALAIECKTSTAKPWVAFTAPVSASLRVEKEYGALGYLSRSVFRHLPVEVIRTQLPKLRFGEKLAHGVVQSLVDRKAADSGNPAYAAMRSAVSATAALASENDRISLEGTAEDRIIQLIMPAVVLDGLLFEFSLAADGEEILERSEWLQALSSDPLNPAGSTIVHVCTREYLPELLRTCAKELQRLQEEIQPHLSSVYASARNNRLRASVSRGVK